MVREPENGILLPCLATSLRQSDYSPLFSIDTVDTRDDLSGLFVLAVN